MHTDAIRALKRCDPTLARIIRRVGPCRLKPGRRYFAALCEVIISQQLSTKVAAVLCDRFRGLFPRKAPTPAAVLPLSDADLRGVGLSRQKSAYLRDLARHFADGQVPSRRLGRMTDEEIIDSLIRVKGIGVWTVQMFLIFVMDRPDVLPVADLGLRKAVQQHYRLADLPSAEALTALAEPWRPYRSVATWYLWQSLNNQPMKKRRAR